MDRDRAGAAARLGQCWGVHMKQGGVSPGRQGRLSHTPSGPFSSWHRAPVSRHSALGPGLAYSPRSQPRQALRSATAKACEIRVGIARMYQPAGPPPLHRDGRNGARRVGGEGAGCGSPKGIGRRNPSGAPSPGASSAPGSQRLPFSPLHPQRPCAGTPPVRAGDGAGSELRGGLRAARGELRRRVPVRVEPRSEPVERHDRAGGTHDFRRQS